ncbi:putative ribonuclease H-like domain-containing protein [Tanacetum coccineum]
MKEIKLTGGWDAWNSRTKDGSKTRKKEDSKELVTINGEGVDWTNHSEEDEDYALMACNSSESDTKVWSDAPIIEEYESDSEDEYVSIPTKEQETPSFANQQDYTHRAFKEIKGYITGKGTNNNWNVRFGDVVLVKELQNSRTRMLLNSVDQKESGGNTIMPELYNKMAEAVSIACYVLNRVLVTKPHNKTPYELLTDEKREGPREEEQAFLDELERLKRQEKEANEEVEALRKEFAQTTENLVLQAGADKASSTNIFSTVSTPAKASSTNIVNTVSTPVSTASPYDGLSLSDPTNPEQDNSEIPPLEDIYQNPTDGIFTNSSYDDEGAVADFTNLETVVNVSPIPTSRINSFHPSALILGDPNSAVQTRSKVNKSSGAHAFVSYVQKQRRNNHKDFQHCLFACFLSQNEPKKISEALEDESWVDAMQEELLQFKIQKVWILVDLPYGKKAIGTKWVYRNKKDERGVVVRNKARLVAQGHRQEEGEVYKVVKPLYGLQSSYRACMFFIYFLLKNDSKKETIDKNLFIKKGQNDLIVVQVYVDDIIFGSTKKSWCDEFEALMKSRMTHFLGNAKSSQSVLLPTTEQEYVDAASCSLSFFIVHSLVGNIVSTDCASSGGNIGGQIKKLKEKQAKPVINTQSRDERVSPFTAKIGRKEILNEKLIPEDSLDYMETEDAQDMGRTRDVVDEEKENTEDVLSTEDILSTSQQRVSTDKEKVCTDRPKHSTDGKSKGSSQHESRQSFQRRKEKGVEKKEQTFLHDSIDAQEIPAQPKFRAYKEPDQYEKIKRSDEDFISIGSAEDERLIKKMNEKGIDSSKNEMVKEEDKEEEGTKKGLGVEIMEKKSVIARLSKVSSPDGDYLVIYRANGNFRGFNYLMEVLHIFDRQDLFHLYDLMREQFSEVTLDGFELILWGDLKIMMESSTEGNVQSDFWSGQQDWKIVTWRLYESCGVCILEFEDGIVIHMLVERRYPLSKDLLQRMLDLGLEVERESSVALDLIRFIKHLVVENDGIEKGLSVG